MQHLRGERFGALAGLLRARPRRSRNEAIDYSEDVELLAPEGGALGLCERDAFSGLVGMAPTI